MSSTLGCLMGLRRPGYNGFCVSVARRLDMVRPGLGDLGLLTLITEQLGAKMWRETMVVLTHAHACRAAMGAGYEMYSRQRRNIMMQLIRQAAGDMQSRNPIHIVDCHPECPTNSFGQQVRGRGVGSGCGLDVRLVQ